MAPWVCNAGALEEENGCKFIVHQVTKMDTLAGIAIKYGVEVADIKRMNCLATDLQMFALQTLRIPLPGRHPPSTVPANGSADTWKKSPVKLPYCNGSFGLLDSFESLRLKPPKNKASPAMNSLQKHYGLKLPISNNASEGMEMAVYCAGTSGNHEDAMPPKSSSFCNSTPKNGSLVGGFMPENSGPERYESLINIEDESPWENSFWSHQKGEAKFSVSMPEQLLKEENSSGGVIFSTIRGKNLDLRRKSTSRTSLVSDGAPRWSNSIPDGLGDPSNSDDYVFVRKSCSSSSLQDQESNDSSSSMWPPMLPVLSAASIAKPIFAGRKNKTALD
ncbi:hypothetical protein SAY87_004334 [Trapa incisa]|uniref:LysM domain-containing protein n=1 Tax=Trapa incisa TaxID=236973 RepID=A0AAN7JNN4_9MYRT|nr:hypothetical protein SAY87_004334 [Trapa incisa]